MSRNLCPLYIVDDEVPVLESMAFMLESYGYSVDVYSNGQDFLQSVNLHKLDVYCWIAECQKCVGRSFTC